MLVFLQGENAYMNSYYDIHIIQFATNLDASLYWWIQTEETSRHWQR